MVNGLMGNERHLSSELVVAGMSPLSLQPLLRHTITCTLQGISGTSKTLILANQRSHKVKNKCMFNAASRQLGLLAISLLEICYAREHGTDKLSLILQSTEGKLAETVHSYWPY